MKKKQKKQKNNLGMIIGILIIILAALGMMFCATMYYQNRKDPYELEKTTEERQPIKIPDITNPPATQEVVTTEQETSNAVTESEDATTWEPETQEITTLEPETQESVSTETVAVEEETDSIEAQFMTEEQSSAEEPESMSDPVFLTEEISSEVPGEEVTESVITTEEIVTEEKTTEEVVTEESSEEPVTEAIDIADEYLKNVYQGTLGMSGSHLVDLTAYTAPTATELIAMIEAYTVPDRAYLDGAPRTAGDFSYAISRRNLGPIHDPVELRYGILVANASVRSFPTWQKLSNGTSADDPDALQETMLSAGEGVIVLHQSEDQIWSFVQAGCYNGWVQTSAIGFCTREEMTAFIASEDFAVITVPYVEIGGVNFRMGSRLPVTEINEDACVVKMPQADAQGNLMPLEVSVSKEYISDGYLELSSDAMVEQARKLLGVNYGWGDSNNYMDCTSTLRAVYSCFGITLPRNSSWMPNCALNVIDLREMGAEQKRQVITSLAPGSILLVSGHAMMYIGQQDGVESMLHNVTQYLPSAGSALVKPMKCVITPITICNSAGVNYLELYRYAISVDWNMITE